MRRLFSHVCMLRKPTEVEEASSERIGDELKFRLLSTRRHPSLPSKARGVEEKLLTDFVRH